MKIREYKISDSKVCVEIFKSNIPKFFLPEELSGFEEYLTKYTDKNYWVLEHADKVLACGGIGVRGGEGRLHYGMVANEWHKKGLGSKLIKFRLAKLIENPEVSAISLDTSQHNPNFFSRFGFIETSAKENAYGQGLHRHDMRWELPLDHEARETIRHKLLSSHG